MILAIVLTVASAYFSIVKMLGIFAGVIDIICQLSLTTPRADSFAFRLGVVEMKFTLMHRIRGKKLVV